MIGTQSRDSENAQRNLEIVQILRLRGTYTLCAAEGLAWLPSQLYSTRLVNGQSMRVTPMSHSLDEVSTHGQLQDTRPR